MMSMFVGLDMKLYVFLDLLDKTHGNGVSSASNYSL